MRWFFLFMLAAAALYSATLSGSVYSYDEVKKLNGAVLRFEGATSHQIVSYGGDYSIDIPPGNYTLIATYIKDGSLKYYTKEHIYIGERNQTYDVVMFPPSFFDADSDLPDLWLDVPNQKPAPESDFSPFLLFSVLLLAALLVIYVIAKKRQNAGAEGSASKEIDEEGRCVLKLLKENEGRMEQKRLREILGFSESKMSLLLTELEVIGMIKRFKKGRENIVKLKGDARW